MGTGAFFMGLPVAALELNRARGLEATPSSIELYVPNWDTLSVEPPAPGETSTSPARGEDESLAFSAANGTVRNRTGGEPGRIRWAGWLGLCEIDTSGRQWGPFLLGPFYVTRIQSVRRSNNGQITRVRLIVADSRFFWGLGGLTAWSFNRRRPDGTSARDSERPGGGPWTPAQVLERVTRMMNGVTSVSRTPLRLSDPQGGIELEPGAPACDGVRALLLRFGLADPCLQWDNRVAYYARGEGRIGHSPGGTGPNADPLDPPYLDKGGAGYGREVEFGYPPDYVRVFGGKRITSVAVDRWEAVLHLPKALVLNEEEGEGSPTGGQGGASFFPLTEGLLQKLVPGDAPPGGHATWLDWLHVWILGPKSYQGIPGLSRKVAETLAQQAYRLWRLRGAVVEGDPLLSEVTPGPNAPPTGGPGPNANLLPLLDRADLVGGRRLPVTVETYSFAPVNWAFRGSEGARRQQLQSTLDQLREELVGAQLDRMREGVTSIPFGSVGDFEAGDQFATSEIAGLLGTSVDPLLWQGFNAAIREARFVIASATKAGDKARAYEAALIELYEEEGGYRKIVYTFAKEVVETEVQLRAGKTVLEGIRGELEDRPDLLLRLQARARAMSVEALNLKRSRELATRTGVQGEVREPRMATFYENLEREADAGASIYDREAGVVRTSRLAGWLEKPAVAVAHATNFVPKPVRVIFGSVVRPRTDLPPAALPNVDNLGRRPETGTTPGDGGSGDQIPLVLADDESYYVATFRRTEAGIVPLGRADTVAPFALTVHHPELAELVGLDGSGNVTDLDRRAREIARAAMDRPAVISEKRVTLPHLWLVQCDGLVAGVQIKLRPKAAGFETVVEIGHQKPTFAPLETSERRKPPQRGGTSDGALREGLLP